MKIKFALVLSNIAQFYFSVLCQLREQRHLTAAHTAFSESSQEKQPRTQWKRGQMYSPPASR